MVDPVREATRDDLLELLRMGREFADAIGMELDRERFVSSLESMMDSDDAWLVVTDGGMAAGLMYPSYFTDGLIAQELWWWVDPKARRNGIGSTLLEAFESWAIGKGARRILLTSTHKLKPNIIGKIYKEKGYSPQEHVYVKDI